jgi:hypothetical protein
VVVVVGVWRPTSKQLALGGSRAVVVVECMYTKQLQWWWWWASGSQLFEAIIEYVFFKTISIPSFSTDFRRYVVKTISFHSFPIFSRIDQHI